MVRVINKGKGKLNLRFGVSLPPGAEVEVSPEMWGKCKDDPITKHYLSIQLTASCSQ